MAEAPASDRKVLAIAVLRDGKVVNKLIPERAPIRLGSGFNNNIVIEHPGIPESSVFIMPGPDRDTWVLRLSESMTALITSADGTRLNFADLKDLGIFPVDDQGCYLLHVKHGDQGQVEIGPYTVHFGFIAPPERKEPEKPAPRAEKQAAETAVPEKVDPRVLKISVEAHGVPRKDVYPNAGIMTIGEADYNTVPVRNAGLPRIHTLMEPHGNKYVLRLLPQIKGGVEVRGSIIPFSTLIERNLMKQEKPGDPWIWVMDKNVSGVISIAGTDVFFSFAEPPAEALPKEPPKPAAIIKKPVTPSRYEWSTFAARPHDPVAFKGQGAEKNRLQMAMGLILFASLVGGAVFDRLVVVTLESKQDVLRRAPTARVASLANPPAQTQIEGLGEEIVSESGIGEQVGTVGGPGGGTPGGGGGGPAGVAAGTAAGQNVLQNIGFAAYGTQGVGGGSGFIGDLQSAASSGLGLASGQTGEAMIAGAGGGGSGGLTGLVPVGGGVVQTAETVSQSDIEAVHRAAQVSFSASSSGEALDLGQRSMTDIRGRINVIKMRIQTAYESLLRTNPAAGGVIYINFSITPSGSVTGISVNAPGDLASLQPTIQAAVASLNFGPAEGQTSNLDTSVSFNLIPPE
ncbi:MAG TPA: hypothetical protein PLF04_07385 [Candidatus Fermentibacter daniensis]|jgi:hypothetical protein|nr:MAG: hypothetical protein AO396_06175 [Candidatus Fermentibacter daniensis]MBP7720424.1 hypothetical protein [Candidatus Fermentibacter sp.]OQC69869.1 MAG: hypothetical protein BWX47_00847 [candidate division Hyd24-12 bacterium ADurb.Bin004]KZD18847.1 MAG: hypothetical protein AO395_09040 [Candidatus Fermentibacter daniensis]HOA05682.1 hypothetical protein [Candidatus Fermentibacter daniensis]